MTKNTTANHALRLPCSLKTEVERLAAQGGVSVNQFIATALAEKTSQFFVERQAQADFPAFNRIISRCSGEPPHPEDEPI